MLMTVQAFRLGLVVARLSKRSDLAIRLSLRWPSPFSQALRMFALIEESSLSDFRKRN